MSAPMETDIAYGVSHLDQLDDDDTPSSSSGAPTATTSTDPSNGTNNTNTNASKDDEPGVESYGVAVGVIEPPPDLKVIIDRTADFVRRVGPQFEGEIIQRNKGKKQFQFLENPASPYHPYYKQRVRYGAEGPPKKAGEQALDHASALAKAQEAEAKRRAAEEEKKNAVPEEPKKLTLQERLQQLVVNAHKPDKSKLEEAEAKQKEKDASLASAHKVDGAGAPPASSLAGSASHANFTFKLKHPDQYNPVDIDIIKLTALYMARCGLEFLHGLQRRESKNPYFDFLKPQHPLFVFFQHLVDSYKKIIKDRAEMKEEVEKDVRLSRTEFFQNLLIQAVLRKKRQLAELKLREQEEGTSALSFIDWKDFVVLDQVVFKDEEDDLLPVPRETVEEMAAMLSAPVVIEEEPQDQSGDVDMDVDEPSHPAVSPPTAVKAESEEDEVQRLIRSAVTTVPTHGPGKDDEELEVRLDTEDDSYAATKARPGVFQKCQVCGDEIAIDDLAEHMRIELLDPRWKEQKQALLDRQRESSLATDATVGQNLARLAKRTAALQGEDKEDAKRAELKARKQALADAILLYGPQSLQAREAAAKAGELVPLPAPTPAVKPTPAPAPAIQSGPAARPQPPSQAAGLPPPPQSYPQSSPHIPIRPPGMPAQPAMGPPGVPGAQGMYQPPRPMPPAGPPGLTGYAPPPGVPDMPPAPVAYPSFQPYGPPGMMPAPPGAFPPGVPMGPPGFAQPPPPISGFPPMPPSGPPGMPSAPFQPPPPPPGTHAGQVHGLAASEDEPAAKKQRTDAGPGAPVAAPAKGKLVPEAEWLASHPAEVTVRISVPSDSTQPFNFQGQDIVLNMRLTDTLQQLKEQLQKQLNNMPPNKMKLQFSQASGGAHLNKDTMTLAAYNTINQATIMLGIKERGGKK